MNFRSETVIVIHVAQQIRELRSAQGHTENSYGGDPGFLASRPRMQLGSPGSLPKLFAWLLCKPEGQLLTTVTTQHLSLRGLGQDDRRGQDPGEFTGLYDCVSPQCSKVKRYSKLITL